MAGQPKKRVSYVIFHCIYSTSLHVLYTSLVIVYVNYSLGTPTIFQVVHNYLVVRLLAIYYHKYSFTIITLCSTMNINLCLIVYSVLHGVLIIYLLEVVQHIWTDQSIESYTDIFPRGDIYQLKIISVPQENRHHLEEIRCTHKINYTDNAELVK